MGNSGAFVYLLEEDAVRTILPDWPGAMQVAVCLTPEGSCDLAVHHRDEVGRVLARIAALQAGQGVDLCVTPPVDGYATRKVMFSDEQQLLSLVDDSPGLCDLAHDYAINYRFACDEGLEADPLTGAATLSPAAPPAAASQQDRPAAPAMSARSQAFVTHLSLPSGYATQIAADAAECLFETAHLSRRGAVIRLVICPDQAKGSEVARHVPRVGWRDDFARFVVPRQGLDGWSAGQAAVIELPVDLFPQAMIGRLFRDGPATVTPCEVTITARGVFVAPRLAGVVAPIPATPAAPTAPVPTRRRTFRTVHLAVVVLVAAMLLTGHFAAARDRSVVQVVSASDSRPDATSQHQALDLVAAMTGQDMSRQPDAPDATR